jgi:hypothetical protein
VIDERLWFLLKHEFRLWHRSSNGLPAQWPGLLLMAGFTLLAALFEWARNNFQFFPFDASAPSDTAIWFAGGFVNYFVFLVVLVSLFFSNGRAMILTTKLQARNWLHSTPLPSQIRFASEVLQPILTSFIAGNIFLLVFSSPLALILQSLRLWGGIHLAVTVGMVVFTNLQFWILYAFAKWGNSRLWKMLRFAFQISFLGIILFILGLPMGIGGSVLPFERVVQIVLEQCKPGNILGSDSWLWVPGKIVFLDPLPSLVWVILAIFLPWLTIRLLHRPLSFDLQSYSNAQKQVASTKKTTKQFQENLACLFISREWKQMMGQTGVLSMFLILTSYGLLFTLSSVKEPATSLGASGVLIPTLNSMLSTHYGFANDPMRELLRSSPINIKQAKTCKIFAVLAPIWISLLPIIITVGILGKPWALIAALGFAATTSQTFLRAWNACPVTAVDLLSNYNGDDALGCRDAKLTWIELFSFLLWLIISTLLLTGNIWSGCFFLLLEGYLFYRAYRRNQRLGDSWSG